MYYFDCTREGTSDTVLNSSSISDDLYTVLKTMDHATQSSAMTKAFLLDYDQDRAISYLLVGLESDATSGQEVT